MLCCLGFSVACWDFQLLVVCGRWLEAKSVALQGKGCLYSFEPAPPEVHHYNSDTSRTSVPGREAAMPSSWWSPGIWGLELG